MGFYYVDLDTNERVLAEDLSRGPWEADPPSPFRNIDPSRTLYARETGLPFISLG